MEGRQPAILFSALGLSLLGLAAAPQGGACNLGVLCAFGVPAGQSGDPYIDFVVNSSTVAKCRCDDAHPQGGVIPCVTDAATACSFDVSFAFTIPTGKSVKYNGDCYTPGQFGPRDFGVRAGGACGASFYLQFTVYDNENCEGTGTPVSFGGACVPTNQSCKDRDC